MTKVKISPKYQVVIPREIRNAMKLEAGEELNVIQYGDRIELVPVKKMKQLRGFLKGIDTSVEREVDRL